MTVLAVITISHTCSSLCNLPVVGFLSDVLPVQDSVCISDF